MTLHPTSGTWIDQVPGARHPRSDRIPDPYGKRDDRDTDPFFDPLSRTIHKLFISPPLSKLMERKGKHNI